LGEGEEEFLVTGFWLLVNSKPVTSKQKLKSYLIMQDFKKLQIWQQGMDLVIVCYHLTKTLPKEELYDLTAQIKSAVKSIPSNIAEGCSRRSQKDFFRFLEIALGSAFELETHILTAIKLNFINEKENEVLLQKITSEQKMIYSLMQTLNQ
jgi:four helix bundle protein